MQLVLPFTVSAVLLGIVGASFVALHKSFGRSGAAAFFLLSLLISFLTMFTPIWWGPELLVLCIFGAIIGKGTRQRVRVAGTSIICILSLLNVVRFGIAERSRILTLQTEFPMVSLNERLAYEETANRAGRVRIVEGSQSKATLDDLPTDFEETALSPEIKGGLSQAESEFAGSWRAINLERLHDENAVEFAITSGFGVSRMMPLSVDSLSVPKSESVPFEEPIPETASYVEIDGVTSRAEESETDVDSGSEVTNRGGASHVNLRSTYEESVSEFLDVDMFGYIESKQRVAGFEPHAFRRSTQKGTTWSLVRLELVSLLKFDEPCVYVSESLPNMRELDEVETRPLSAFEAKSLPRLFRETNVVIEEEDTDVRMLGALRADSRCLNCHSVKRGQLLGAFSYRLRLKN